MPTNIALSERAYPVGQRVFSIDTIPANSTGFKLSFTRVNWPEGPCLSLLVEIAPDGVNFVQWLNATVRGGVILDRNGAPLVASSVSGSWPGHQDANGARVVDRQTDVRLTAQVLQPLTSAVTLSAV